MSKQNVTAPTEEVKKKKDSTDDPSIPHLPSRSLLPRNISVFDQTEQIGHGHRDETWADYLIVKTIVILSMTLVVLTFPFSLCAIFVVIKEYERIVIFRMGKLRQNAMRGPGCVYVLPCIDEHELVDIRTVTVDIPPQEILTKDGVTVVVDAVVNRRVVEALRALVVVKDYHYTTLLLAATTLRTVLGTRDLSQVISEKKKISVTMQMLMDEVAHPWGIDIESVEITDIELPSILQKAMAAEAEARREAKAKLLIAEGEVKTAKALKEASGEMAASPLALQLRYLQSLTAITADRNSTIIFPFPLNFFRSF